MFVYLNQFVYFHIQVVYIDPRDIEGFDDEDQELDEEMDEEEWEEEEDADKLFIDDSDDGK